MKLTAKFAQSRARVQSLDEIVTLNCWGSNLDDLSILKDMPNLQVLSLRYACKIDTPLRGALLTVEFKSWFMLQPNIERLWFLFCSVNSISSLEVFSSCTQLRELFLRRNKVADINEIVHLQVRFFWYCVSWRWLAFVSCFPICGSSGSATTLAPTRHSTVRPCFVRCHALRSSTIKVWVSLHLFHCYYYYNYYITGTYYDTNQYYKSSVLLLSGDFIMNSWVVFFIFLLLL